MVAWLLVGLALYWLYAGMGYRPLLLLQLMLFSERCGARQYQAAAGGNRHQDVDGSPAM